MNGRILRIGKFFWKMLLLLFLFYGGCSRAIIPIKQNIANMSYYKVDKVLNRDSVMNNTDSLLFFFSEYLNSYIENGIVPYFVTKEGICMGGFGIVDISDTLNSTRKRIYFSNNHVYLFGPIRLRFEYCNVAIFTGGRLKIFKAINCPKIGDKLADVIQYINVSLPNDVDKKFLITRISNLPKYGVRAKLKVDDEDLIYDKFECDYKYK